MMTECSGKLLDSGQIGWQAQRLRSDLRQRVVGQDEAIDHIVQVYQKNLAGMSPQGRPIANLLFLGPTGSGKTRLVESVCESLIGHGRAVIKVDCGEFQHSHEISKLIGSPPGYLGHRDTQPLLSQQTLNQFHTDRVRISFLLLDEIEKASDALWNLLLGILDRATLTLGDNRRVDFSRTMIFMTSNLGVAEMNSIVQPRLGFAPLANRKQPEPAGSGALTDKVARAGIEAARRKFPPEFMNRLDKAIVFRPLGIYELRDILSIELNAIQEHICCSPHLAPFAICVTEPARDHLLEQGTDLMYGARHLKRAIDRLLVQPLSNLIATGQILRGDVIRVDFDGTPGRLMFFKDSTRVKAASTGDPRH